MKIGFWNVARVRGKDKNFWERVKKWDVIGLVETWVKEKKWKQWERKVLKKFKWSIQRARKKEKKGRAKGGI